MDNATIVKNSISLEEIKAMLDGTRNQQLRARIEFVQRLRSLGFFTDYKYKFPHPTEEDKFVEIHISSDYKKSYEEILTIGYLGWFDVKVVWKTPHCCDENCQDYCHENYDKNFRPATAEEVVAVLRTELLANLELETTELQRNWELAKAIPTEDDIASLRRKVEDYLRKNPGKVVAVARLLKFIE